MRVKDAMDGYDYDLPLMDALNDPDLPVIRRVLAGAVIGEGLDTAYFATSELLEAFVALEADARREIRHGEGLILAEEILEAANPLQLRLWHLICDRAVGQAMTDLGWLRGLAYQRGRMARVLREEALPLQHIPDSELVDGPTAADMMHR